MDEQTLEDELAAIDLELSMVHAQLSALQNQKNSSMLTDIGVAFENELNKKEFNLKEKKVKLVHTNAIQIGTIMKNGKEKTYYQTRVKGMKTPPRCYSYESLIEKLYEHYYGTNTLIDYTFKSVFEAAQEEYKRTVGPKDATLLSNQYDYNRYISDDLGNRDIRTITSSELKAYIQSYTKEHAMTTKQFHKLKGVFNKVFDYASDPDVAIIPRSVVPKDNRPFQKNLVDEEVDARDKAFTPAEVDLIREYIWDRADHMQYDYNGYAILFSSHTGLRQGEIPSLKWEDIDFEKSLIHVHTQQNEKRNGKEVSFYLNPTTKNEKGHGRGGRYVPMTNETRKILLIVKEKQQKLGIRTEWVFAKKNGDWNTTRGYYESLYKICNDKLHLKLSNNHAFRIALNSYVFIPMGIDAPERARILGHSVETNLKHYTFSREKEYLTEIGAIWDQFNDSKNSENQHKHVV